MSTVIDTLERQQLREVPRFGAGDRVRVHFQVVEGNRRRVQVFEGVVLRRQGSGARETFTVRKQSFGVGVERTFPLHSPKIEKIEVAARGAVRRAKLYYLRDRVGKASRVAERRWGVDDEVLAGGEAVDASGQAADEVEPEASPESLEEAGEGEEDGGGGESGADASGGSEEAAAEAGKPDAEAAEPAPGAESEDDGDEPADAGDAEQR